MTVDIEPNITANNASQLYMLTWPNIGNLSYNQNMTINYQLKVLNSGNITPITNASFVMFWQKASPELSQLFASSGTTSGQYYLGDDGQYHIYSGPYNPAYGQYSFSNGQYYVSKQTSFVGSSLYVNGTSENVSLAPLTLR